MKQPSQSAGEVSPATTVDASAPEAKDISVVVCTRDRAELLQHALAALQQALPAAVELIVVDSGSVTTATEDVATAARVRYVRSDVPGLSIARNVGLHTSSREIVVFTDDDCLVASDFLTPLVAPFSSPAVGATTGTLRDIANDESAHADTPPQTLTRVTEGIDAGHGALMAFRRPALIALGGFDEALGAGRHFGGAEDMDAICRVLRSGLTVTRVPGAVVQHVYTRDDDDYLRLNRNYGLGIGAMCSKWLRGARRDGMRLVALVTRRAFTRYLRRVRTQRLRRGQSAYMRGVAAGLREARRLAIDGLVFIDDSPPKPVASPRPPRPDPTTENRLSA